MWPLFNTCPLGYWVNFVGWFLTSSGRAKGTSLLVLLSFKILLLVVFLLWTSNLKYSVKCNRNPPAELTDSMTESGRNEVLDNLSEKDDGLAPGLVNVEKTVTGEEKSKTSKTRLFEQLCELKYLSLEENNDKLLDRGSQSTNSSILAATRPKSNLIEDFSLFPCFLLFVRQVLQYNVVWAATVLNEAHVRVLGMFITTAFDMARDMVITPRRLDYAREKEEDLYKALMESASRKQEEIKDLIHSAISSLTEQILKEVEELKFDGKLGQVRHFVSVWAEL